VAHPLRAGGRRRRRPRRGRRGGSRIAKGHGAQGPTASEGAHDASLESATIAEAGAAGSTRHRPA